MPPNRLDRESCDTDESITEEYGQVWQAWPDNRRVFVDRRKEVLQFGIRRSARRNRLCDRAPDLEIHHRQRREGDCAAAVCRSAIAARRVGQKKTNCRRSSPACHVRAGGFQIRRRPVRRTRCRTSQCQGTLANSFRWPESAQGFVSQWWSVLAASSAASALSKSRSSMAVFNLS